MKLKLVAALVAVLLLLEVLHAQVPAAPGKADDASFASHVTVEWQTVTMNFTRVNPALSAAAQNGMTDSEVMAINGTITLTDPTHIVAVEQFNSAMDVSRILDADGNDFTFLLNGNHSDRYYGSLNYSQQYDPGTKGFAEKLQPSQFNIPLKATASLPARFARVEAQVHLLVCDKITQVDLPYVAGGPAVEVLPGVRVHFDTATKDANSYHYQLACDPADGGGFDGRVTAEHPIPSQAVIDQFMVDTDGKPIETHHSRFGGSFQSLRSTGSSGGMSGSDKIGALRFTVANGLHEVSIPVVLKNVELPQMGMVTAVMPNDPTSVPAIDRAEATLARRLSDERDRAAQTGWNDARDKIVRTLWKTYKADYESGVNQKVTCAPVLGMTPDVKNYSEYIGKYHLNSPSKVHAQQLDCSIDKDANGRLTLTIGPGRTLPLAGCNGALFGVFDPMFHPSDPLDPKSDPKLAGIWIIKSGGKLTVLTDTGRPQPAMPLEPATTQP